MARDYLNGLVIVAITIILTILLWLFLRNQQESTTELPVYVLIVDEFDSTIEPSADNENENCIIDPSGSAFLDGSGTAFLDGSGTAFLDGSGTAFLDGSGTSVEQRLVSLTHGEIVREVFEASVGADFPLENIINVDLDDYETTHAAERIAETIDELGPAFYIVNMSFSIVPCDFVETPEDYIDLFENGDFSRLEAIFNAMINDALGNEDEIVDDDPILDYINTSCEKRVTVPQLQLPILEKPVEAIAAEAPVAQMEGVEVDLPPREEGHLPSGDVIELTSPEFCGRVQANGKSSSNPKKGGVIFVAAAGNGSLTFTDTQHDNIRFPFAPAIWEDVISISASIVIGADGEPREPNHPFSTFGYEIAPYSNYGAIKMPTPYQGLGGTSFAAPRYSALLAMLLTPGDADFTYTSFCIQETSPLPLPDAWDNRTSDMNQPLC